MGSRQVFYALIAYFVFSFVKILLLKERYWSSVQWYWAKSSRILSDENVQSNLNKYILNYTVLMLFQGPFFNCWTPPYPNTLLSQLKNQILSSRHERSAQQVNPNASIPFWLMWLESTFHQIKLKLIYFSDGQLLCDRYSTPWSVILAWSWSEDGYIGLKLSGIAICPAKVPSFLDPQYCFQLFIRLITQVYMLQFAQVSLD